MAEAAAAAAGKIYTRDELLALLCAKRLAGYVSKNNPCKNPFCKHFKDCKLHADGKKCTNNHAGDTVTPGTRGKAKEMPFAADAAYEYLESLGGNALELMTREPQTAEDALEAKAKRFELTHPDIPRRGMNAGDYVKLCVAKEKESKAKAAAKVAPQKRPASPNDIDAILDAAVFAPAYVLQQWRNKCQRMVNSTKLRDENAGMGRDFKDLHRTSAAALPMPAPVSAPIHPEQMVKCCGCGCMYQYYGGRQLHHPSCPGGPFVFSPFAAPSGSL